MSPRWQVVSKKSDRLMMFRQIIIFINKLFAVLNCKVYHRNAYWFIFQIRVRLRKLTQISACEQVLIGAYIASLRVAVPFPPPPSTPPPIKVKRGNVFNRVLWRTLIYAKLCNLLFSRFRFTSRGRVRLYAYTSPAGPKHEDRFAHAQRQWERFCKLKYFNLCLDYQ